VTLHDEMLRAPINGFKAALSRGEELIGFWQALTSLEATEISAGAGFDWLLFDGEHAPNDMAMLRDQLRASLTGTAHPVVRIADGNDWMLKQALDLGFQTVLIPMVNTAEQGQALVNACLYPPEGHRGVGAALARASNFGRRSQYLSNANDEICILLQVESVEGLKNLDAILQVERVDGVFIGPADLSADMGFRGQPTHPEMRSIIRDATRRIKAAGKAPGILLNAPEHVDEAREDGAQFIAVGSDVGLFMRATTQLAQQYKRT
jgi:4-hydroxy-2-oxoheptanedioate aldolase